MDENENIQAEEVEAEVADEDLEFFDESWDDEDADIIEPTADEPEEVEEQAADGPDQPEGDQPEEEDAGEEPQEGKKEEERNQLFEINYLGNREQLTLDQMTELAQKGRNYDHVVEERDRLKGETGKYGKFLQELADRAGLSIDEQIDRTRAMWLMNDEFDKGNEISEADALLQVQRVKNAPKEEPKNEEQQTNNTTKMIDRFLAVYPNVKATEIPKEIWDAAVKSGDLLGEYQAFEIKRLKAENEKTKREARNEQNAKRSTGPRKTSGRGRQIDDFDAAWDSDD